MPIRVLVGRQVICLLGDMGMEDGELDAMGYFPAGSKTAGRFKIWPLGNITIDTKTLQVVFELLTGRVEDMRKNYLEACTGHLIHRYFLDGQFPQHRVDAPLSKDTD